MIYILFIIPNSLKKIDQIGLLVKNILNKLINNCN